MISKSLRWAALLICVALPASAQSKKECADAYVKAQQLKRDGALLEAREQLIVCAKDGCMSAVKKDCLSWLDEVNSGIPSIVVAAKGPDGAETLDVKVSIGDRVLTEKIDEKGIEVDPGTHTFTFEMEGQKPIERELIVRAGEKNKLVEIRFGDAEAKPVGEVPAGEDPFAAEVTGDDLTKSDGGPPVAAYVLGGVGALALVGTAVFWLGSESQKSELEDQGCAPACSQDDVDSIKQKRLFGDIALGVGVVSIGAAAYLIATAGDKKEKPAVAAQSVNVQLLPGGAFGSVGARF